MRTKSKPLFALDLRIHKQLAKLCIYEEDLLEDVIKRFSKLAKLGENFHHKIKDKLQNQLTKLLCKQNCSQTIRDKIESFLEESKIIIIGVTQTQNWVRGQGSLNASIKEKAFEQRKYSASDLQEILKSQQVSPCLLKYASKQILVQQQNQSSIQQLLQKYQHQQRQPAQRQLFNYHHAQPQDQTILQTITSNRIARSQQREKRSLIYQGNTRKNNHHVNQQQGIPELSSYRSYKESHKKSLSKPSSVQLTKKVQTNKTSNQRQCLRRIYPQNSYNLSQLKKQYGQNNISAPYKKATPFKYESGNEYRTKFDYDKCMQAKGVSSGFKQNKKFSYLGQPS